MLSKISILFIKDLLSRINIVDYVDKILKLKKIGNYFYINCPFHYDKIPSCSISYEKQMYYCFGCEARGNIINFVMNYNKFSFTEAIEELSKYCGIEISYEDENKNEISNINEKRNLFEFMKKITNLYQKCLDCNYSKYANEYLYSIRGLDEKTVKIFKLGFAPKKYSKIDDYSNFYNENISFLKKTGFVSSKGKVNFNIFYERIMFPIRDFYGNVIAFGGRSIKKYHYPKYLNSPNTLIFNKSRNLYGLYESMQNYTKLKRLLLVEGYMDVLTLFQFGINYAVSALGTAINSNHIKLMYKNTDTIICCYDGDNSGRTASWRTLKQAVPYLTDGRKIRFVFLPNREDPDSLIRKIGKLEFMNYIDNSISFFDFLFQKLASNLDMHQYEEKAKLGKYAISLINLIPGQLFKFYLKKRLCIELGIPCINLIVNNKNIKFKPVNKIFKLHYNIVSFTMGILIQNPDLHNLITNLNYLEKIDNQEISLFVQIIQVCRNNDKINTAQLLEFFKSNKHYNKLEKLAVWNHMIIDNKIKETFSDSLIKLYNYTIELRQENLISLSHIRNLTMKEKLEFFNLNKEKVRKHEV